MSDDVDDEEWRVTSHSTFPTIVSHATALLLLESPPSPSPSSSPSTSSPQLGWSRAPISFLEMPSLNFGCEGVSMSGHLACGRAAFQLTLFQSFTFFFIGTLYGKL